MSEESDRARFYQQHRDDPEIWGEPSEGRNEGSAEPRDRLGATITVRFRADEAEYIRAMAKRLGMTYSDIVRKAVTAFVRPSFSVQETSQNILQSYEARPRRESVETVFTQENAPAASETGTTR